MKSAAILALLLALPAAAPAQTIEAKADRIIDAAMREKHIPGLVLAIVKDGKVVVKKGYGVKHLAPPEAPDANTVFSIGSVSKALTAFGVMRLVDEGKVSLDVPASRYVQGMPAAWQPITVRQFMTHTSGIPEITAKLPTFEGMLRYAANLPMAFPPGTSQEYNNFNYAVAGEIIHSVTGQPYLAYMQSHVFAPLGMHDSGESGTVKTRNRATGYAIRGKGLVPVETEPKGGDYAIPSGFLETTLNDFLKFNDALRTHALMKRHTYEEMFTPTVVPGHHLWSFTPGYQARKAGNALVIAKNGAVTGFSSQYQFVHDGNDAVIMIWNVKGKGLDLWETAAQLLYECLGVPRPTRPQP